MENENVVVIALCAFIVVIIHTVAEVLVSKLIGYKFMRLKQQVFCLSFVLPLVMCIAIWYGTQFLQGSVAQYSLLVVVVFNLQSLFSNTRYLISFSEVGDNLVFEYYSPLMVKNELVVPFDQDTTFLYKEKRNFHRLYNAVYVKRKWKVARFYILRPDLWQQCQKLNQE